MAKFKVEAGDFIAEEHGWLMKDGRLRLPVEKGSVPRYEHISLSRLETVEAATEESVKRLGGTVGWGLAGAVVLGPVGLLAGLLAGGKKKRVTFIAVLDDGRKFMATGSHKDYIKMRAATF